MKGVSFDIQVRMTVIPARAEASHEYGCPACGFPLNVHQPEGSAPHRLLATCSCEECGIWLALVAPPDRRRTYMIRLPEVAELREEIARQTARLKPRDP